MQDSSSTLLHGPVGEKFVNHYTFYAAFAADEEFRIVCSGRTLGTLPVSQALSIGQRILFAGKTWRVEDIDEQQKTIFVVRAGGGAPPLFTGGTGRIHTRVRQRMRELLESAEVPPYLDVVAQRFLAEGRTNHAARGLAEALLVDQGSEVLLLTWLGDAANQAVACLLQRRGFNASPAGPGVEVLKGDHSTEDTRMPPGWMIRECVSFRTWAFLYEGLEAAEQKQISDAWKFSSGKRIDHTILEDWFHSLSILRNRCAHHGRITHKTFPFAPTAPRDPSVAHLFRGQGADLRTLMVVIAVLLKCVDPRSVWTRKLYTFLEWQSTVDIGAAAGFTPWNLGTWRDDPLWSF